MRADTGAQIAIMNGGGVRANIEPGEVTLGHVLTVHPFGNLLSTFEATGATIVAALENGVSGLQVEGGVLLRDGAPGRFPQVSGLRYSFDPNLEPGSRVTSVEVLGEDGTYAPIDSEAIYSVATLNFIRTGGDGYSMFANDAIDPYDFGRLDYEATSEFLITNSPINYAVEGRIMIENVTIQPLTE
jgi:5'-nucleotidase